MKTQRNTLLSVAVLFASLTLCLGQTPSDSIYLDPIETTPQMPSSYSMENDGNWGIPFLNIDDYAQLIETHAERPVVVIIFDTAGKLDHSALQSAVWPVHDLTFTGEDDPTDKNGHGTHVAGIYAGLHNSANIGVGAPLVKAGKLKVIVYKVLNNNGRGANTGIYQGMRAANELAAELIKEGYFVIYNFSLGGGGRNAVFDSFMKIARDQGVFVVGASGNDNTDRIITPANGPDVWAVGAMNNEGKKAYFSTYGEGLWLIAPGQSIYSTYPPNTYRELSGTSMATPFQGAIAAIVASLKPKWSNDEVAEFIENNVKDIPPPGPDKFTGVGYSDADIWFPALKVDDEPDEPDDDPKRSKRDVEIIIDLVLPIKWKPLVDQDFKYHQCEIVVKVKNTDDFAEDIYDNVRDMANRFYNDHVFFLQKNSDFIDAGYWAGEFFQKWCKDEHDTKIDLEEVIVRDGFGRKALVPKRNGVSKMFIQLFNPEIGFTKN